MWKYKDYIIYSVKAKLLTETINNHLGLLWLILDPILKMFVFYFVFVYLIKRRTEDFTSFLLIGLIAFQWFSKSVMQGGNSIQKSQKLMEQLHLPKIIFPTISFAVRTIEFLIILTLLMVYFVLRGHFYITWLAIPAVFLTQLFFVYGVTLFFAAVIPFIPDLSFLLSSALTALMFLSGVIYRVTPDNPQYNLFMLNPLAKLFEQYRTVILYGQWPEWSSLSIICGIGIALIVAMSRFLKKHDCYYPRLVR